MTQRQFTYRLLLICTFSFATLHTQVTSAHGTLSAAAKVVSERAYEPKSTGTRKIALGNVTIRMLIDKTNLGQDDIEIGELILPAGSPDSVLHAHRSLEIFYVIEGTLGHEVNGKQYTINPGEVGFLKPGDKTIHRVLSKVPVKALVIWMPGGEADSLVEHANFVEIPYK